MIRMMYLRGYLALSVWFVACGDPVANTTEDITSSTGPGETTGTPTTGSGGVEETGSTVTPTGDGSSSSGGPPAVCGDGVVEGDEACDDASDEPLDGCDKKCRLTAKELWTQSWDSGAKLDDGISAVVLDAAGNIYVAGYIKTAELQLDAVLRKLGPDGAELMSVTYAGDLGLDEAANALAIGADGSLYMGGWQVIDEMEHEQGWVRKYDEAGKELWAYELTAKMMDGDANVRGLAVDGDAVYAAAQETVDDPTVLLNSLQRIDGGEQQWRFELEKGVSAPLGLAITPDSDVILATAVRPAPDMAQPWIGRFSAEGDKQWGMTYLPDGGYARAVAVAGDGTLYVTGTVFFNTPDAWVARLDAQGNELWSDALNPDYGDDRGQGIAIAADGGFYVAATVTYTNQQQNILVRRYDVDGMPVWTDVHDDESSLFDGASGIAVGADGVVAAGSEFVLMHGQNQWIRKYGL